MVYIFASIGFFLWVTRSLFFWTGLWQLKEYRLDRLIVHIKETLQGRSILLSPFLFSNVMILLLYTAVVLNDNLTYPYELFVTCYFLFLGGVFLWEIVTNSFKRPAITMKAGIICFVVMFMIVIGYLFNLADKFVWLLLLVLIMPMLVAIVVFALSFPTELYKDYLIQKARKRLLKYPNLLVIGISGSYGKSSTKEYIAQILARKFTVVKTTLSNNTPIAIANTILKQVRKDTQICVIEIGAYKKGEVDEICSMVSPNISITTAIGEQHISLYGSMENILASEKELLLSLPKNGMAMFNANSPHMSELYKEAKKKRVLYGTDTMHHTTQLDILAQSIQTDKNGIAFSCGVGQEYLHFHTELLGVHNVENILPAIYLGHYLGLTGEEIKKGVEELVPLPKTMKKFTTQQGIVFIDDSFNASPESVIAAVSYMKFFTKQKIFILHPLIELGKKAKEYHKDIGRELAFFDYLFVTNKNFIANIQEGIKSMQGTCKVIALPKDKIAEQISTIAKKGDVVLFEGKETSSILNSLL